MFALQYRQDAVADSRQNITDIVRLFISFKFTLEPKPYFLLENLEKSLTYAFIFPKALQESLFLHEEWQFTQIWPLLVRKWF